MVNVTNIGKAPQHFRLKSGEFETLAPGQSKRLAINPEAANVQARVHAGAISIEGGDARKAAPKPASAPVTTSEAKAS